MGDLSRNFNRSEFACKCGCGYDRINSGVVAALQAIRDEVAAPVTVSSGCRCESHNRSVGGAANSQHLSGNAADFIIHGLSSSVAFAVVRRLHLRGKIYVGYAYQISRTAIHIDVRMPESQVVKRWRQG